MMEISRADAPHAIEAARVLVREHFDAHSSVHDAASIDAIIAALPAPFLPPAGGLWVAWDESEALGCAALRVLEPDVAELKRMFVRPEHRGRGVARALAERVIAEARAIGYARLRLGTLTSMLAAQRLYARLGFRSIPPYRAADFGDTLFYELTLDDRSVPT